MPLQEDATKASGRSTASTTAATLRLVGALTTIIVRTRPVLLLLLATTARLAMGLRTTAEAAASLFIAGDTVARCELDFQLNDFIPLLIAPITLWDRQQFPQTALGVERLGDGGSVFGKVFGIWIVHCKLKAEPVENGLRNR